MEPYRFAGGWEFQSPSGELRDGSIVRLEPQPAAVLALLAEHAGEVVTYERIRQALWGDGIHVNFRESVHYSIRQVRVALGDRPRDPLFIETIPRRGYRLKADALVRGRSPSTGRTAASPARRLALAAAVAVFAASTAIVEQRPNNHHEIAASILKTVHDLVF